MKDIISSFTIFMIAFCWIHFMDLPLPSEVRTCVLLTIYAHFALGTVYIVRFAMARPKVPRAKKATAHAIHEDREHHLSPVMD